MEPLKPLEQITEPDGRWQMFNVSFPRLYAIVDAMTLNEKIPENVRVQFQQAQHLLVFSHRQFSLVAVAFTQALIAVECALLTRWKRDYPDRAVRSKSLPGLNALLTFAREKKWVHDFNPAFFDLMPSLRNDLVHGGYMLAPIDTLYMVGDCAKFIQQLYPIDIKSHK
jgi:hypothetical protein